jgi:transglutaminase superfamily protein
MARLLDVFCIPPRDAILLVEACAWIVTFKLALKLLPFRWLWRGALLLQPTGKSTAPPVAVLERARWALHAASRRIPSTCLAQALAGHALLGRRGYRTNLKVGVARGGQGQFKAHAWLECQSRVIVGSFKAGEYKELLALGGSSQ